MLIGIGSGLATVCVPLFLSEIAPPAIKRSLGIMNQLFIVFGMLIGQSLSFPFAKPLIWRWVFAVSSGLAVVQLAGSLLVRDPSKSDAIDAQIAGNEELPLIPSGECRSPMASLMSTCRSREADVHQRAFCYRQQAYQNRM